MRMKPATTIFGQKQRGVLEIHSGMKALVDVLDDMLLIRLAMKREHNSKPSDYVDAGQITALLEK